MQPLRNRRPEVVRVSPDDMQRFEARGHSREDAQLLLSCERCGVITVSDEPLTLAELVQRADEHTEVCR